MGDKEPKAYTFTKTAGPQFNLLPDAEPMDYFILFSMMRVLNNIVTETNRYARHKIAKLQLSLWSIWSRWSDVSVPEVKSCLGLIINMGLIPLPDMKDYWSSEGKTDLMSRDRLLQIIWMKHVGNDTTEECSWVIKEQIKYMG
jgi:hypothetical protein